MTDFKETKESHEAVKPQERTTKDTGQVGQLSVQGYEDGHGVAPAGISEDSNIKADQSPEEPSGDDSKGDQPLEEPQSEDADQNRIPDVPEDSAVDRPTIRPQPTSEHLREVEKQPITTEVTEGSKPLSPEGGQPGSPGRRR